MKAHLRRRIFLAPVLFAAVALPANAQAPAPQSATPATGAASATASSFEVASIKMVSPHTLEELQRGIGQFSTSTYPTPHFFMHNAPLVLLVGQAFGMDIEKSPDWGASQLYDVDATVADGKPLTREEMQPLLQNLLAQRFNLKVHRESHAVSGYELVVAKTGPKLQSAREGARPKDMPSAFHAQVWSSGLDAWGISAETLAHILNGPAGQPVVDKTGLSDTYDVHLKFAPSDDPNSSLPSIFTAIQEQLGLKLVPAKVPVSYLVIDHVDRVPTEN
ncbi:MAG TPA: TIGR03435 family protein [Acidobacteriaceae bacterium]|nr:TIGR03435 family protein [Acidobacteriaceae bacterium]